MDSDSESSDLIFTDDDDYEDDEGDNQVSEDEDIDGTEGTEEDEEPEDTEDVVTSAKDKAFKISQKNYQNLLKSALAMPSITLPTTASAGITPTPTSTPVTPYVMPTGPLSLAGPVLPVGSFLISEETKKNVPVGSIVSSLPAAAFGSLAPTPIDVISFTPKTASPKKNVTSTIVYDIKSLSDLTLEVLKEIARKRTIKGFSNKKKTELVVLLLSVPLTQPLEISVEKATTVEKYTVVPATPNPNAIMAPLAPAVPTAPAVTVTSFAPTAMTIPFPTIVAFPTSGSPLPVPAVSLAKPVEVPKSPQIPTVVTTSEIPKASEIPLSPSTLGSFLVSGETKKDNLESIYPQGTKKEDITYPQGYAAPLVIEMGAGESALSTPIAEVKTTSVPITTDLNKPNPMESTEKNKYKMLVATNMSGSIPNAQVASNIANIASNQAFLGVSYGPALDAFAIEATK